MKVTKRQLDQVGEFGPMQARTFTQPPPAQQQWPYWMLEILVSVQQHLYINLMSRLQEPGPLPVLLERMEQLVSGWRVYREVLLLILVMEQHSEPQVYGLWEER